MPTELFTERDASVYENLRREFCEATQKPTMQELAEKFDVPLSTVYRKASEQNWAEMRAARMQQAELQGDAAQVVIQAANRTDAHVMRAFSNVLIVGLEQLNRAISEMREDLAASTRVNIIKEASFAFLNLANGGKALGFASFEKNLDRIGKEDNGRWDPKLLTQINVTVQNLQDKKAEHVTNDLQNGSSPDANAVKTESESKG